MRLLPLLAALPLTLSAAIASQSPLKTDLSIPGNNPLSHCPEPSPDNDLLIIEHVDLSPNPPSPGSILKIHATGRLLKDVVPGAYVQVTVKYGLIKLVDTEIDLCENVGEIGEECPIKNGALDLSKEVELPKVIPPGKYTVRAQAFTEDDEQLTCLTTTIVFTKAFREFL